MSTDVLEFSSVASQAGRDSKIDTLPLTSLTSCHVTFTSAFPKTTLISPGCPASSSEAHSFLGLITSQLTQVSRESAEILLHFHHKGFRSLF